MKKILIAVLAMAALFCFSLTACLNEVGNESENNSANEQSTVEKNLLLDKTSASATVFETITLTATTEGITEAVVWTTSDPATAVVNDGVVTALKAGEVTITASAEGKSAAAQVSFTAPTETFTVGCNYDELVIMCGETRRISAWSELGGVEFESEAVAYSFAVTNPAVVSVNDEGVVTALEAGNTTITVNGTVKGIELIPAEISVTVTNHIEVLSGAEDDTVTIYSYEGRNGDKATTYTVTPVLKVNGEEQENAEFTYTTEGDAATIDASTGIVTAVKTGILKITVSYTEQGGRTVKTALYVYVEKPVYEMTFAETAVIGLFNGFKPVDFGITDEFEAISVDENRVEYTESEGLVKLSAEGLYSGKGVSIAVETDNEIIKFVADIYDYVIASGAELEAMHNVIAGEGNAFSGRTIAIVSDIDCEGLSIATNVSMFKGTIDGTGHTLYNVTLGSRWFENTNNATFKNLAMVNVTRNGGGGGVLVLQSDITTYENLYIQGVFTTASDQGGLFNTGDGTLNNVILQIEHPNHNPAHGRFCTAGVVNASNSYSIARKASDILALQSEDYHSTFNDCGMYNGPAAFAENVDTIKAAFDEEIWTVTNGILTFKTAKPIMDSLFVVEESISITNTETVLYNDNDIAITTDKSGIIDYSLKEAVDGVTLFGNKISANDTATGSVTVVAKWEHPVYNVSVSAEKTFTIRKIIRVDLEQIEYIMQDGAFTYDLNSSGITAVTSVKIGDTAISDYTVSENVITVPASDFFGNVQNVQIVAESADGTKIINLPVYAINYVIRSIADYENIVNVLAAENNKYTGRVMALDADLIVNGRLSSGASGYSFDGTFDGRGHTIYGATLSARTFLYSTYGTFKNIAYENVTLAEGFYGGLFFADQTGGNVTIENVYVHAARVTSAGLFSNMFQDKATMTTVRNVVIIVDDNYTNTSVITKYGYPISENVFVYSPTATYLYDSRGTDGWADETTNVTGLYNDLDAFKAALANASGFSSDIWTTVDGYLMFKSAVNVIKSQLITVNDANLVSGTSVTLSGCGTFTLKEAVNGVSISGNVLNASGEIEAGTVTVVATHPVLTSLTSEYTFTLVPATVENAAQVEYFMQDGSFTYDLTSSGITSVTSVKVGNTEVSDYTLSENVLTIPVTDFFGNVQNVSVLGSTATGAKKLTVPVYAINYVIRSVADYENIVNVLAAENNKYTGRVMALDADLVVNGTLSTGASGYSFDGTFDGRGHTIYGATVSVRPFLYSTNGTFKNIAYVNTTVGAFYGGLFFAEQLGGGHVTFENIYVQAVSLGDNGSDGNGLFGRMFQNIAELTTVRNVVVTIDSTAKAAVITDYGYPVSENVFVYSPTATYLYDKRGESGWADETTNTTGLYNDLDAFNAALTTTDWTITDTMIGNFSKDYWKVVDNKLTWKGLN